MIFDLFPNLEPAVVKPVADAGRQSVAPAGLRKPRIQADSQLAPVTPGVRSDRQLSLDAYARKLVAKAIVRLLPDVPCPERFQKHLEKQSLELLQARRQQLQSENQREFFDAPKPRPVFNKKLWRHGRPSQTTSVRNPAV